MISYKKDHEKIYIKNDAEEIISLDSSQSFLNLVYPIGSIYMNIGDTNPFELFGIGEWERIEDTFLLAAGNSYNLGSEGGEASHTLVNSELPETNGVIVMHQAATGTNIAGVGGCFTGSSVVQGKYRQGGTLLDADASSIGKINYTNGGKNKAHNNMPPYLAVSIWKRIG